MQIAVQTGNSRDTIEKFLARLREQFVFDNVAVYIQDETTKTVEVVYARAVGRSKSAEADAAWGRAFAGQVLMKGTSFCRILGLKSQPMIVCTRPICWVYPFAERYADQGRGVFVRFGGPHMKRTISQWHLRGEFAFAVIRAHHMEGKLCEAA